MCYVNYPSPSFFVPSRLFIPLSAEQAKAELAKVATARKSSTELRVAVEASAAATVPVLVTVMVYAKAKTFCNGWLWSATYWGSTSI